jgi:hypothetical protein
MANHSVRAKRRCQVTLGHQPCHEELPGALQPTPSQCSGSAYVAQWNVIQSITPKCCLPGLQCHKQLCLRLPQPTPLQSCGSSNVTEGTTLCYIGTAKMLKCCNGVCCGNSRQLLMVQRCGKLPVPCTTLLVLYLTCIVAAANSTASSTASNTASST